MDNKLKILSYLGKNLGQSFTMHKLSKIIKMPYATFYRTLQEMKDLINTKIIGKSKTISLNINNAVIKSYLTISSDEEKKEFLKKQPVINKIVSELNTKDIAILFGSYAKGNERANSDIDMLIINEKGNKTLSFLKYEILFRKKINPIFINYKEFISMLNDEQENVGKQALKEHVILQNPEKFWECVLHNEIL